MSPTTSEAPKSSFAKKRMSKESDRDDETRLGKRSTSIAGGNQN